MTPSVPLIGIAGYSGSGKTQLISRLLPLLRDRGIRTGVIKHAHHDFEIDHPGKDSFRFRQAGASETLVASRQRWALMVDQGDDASPEPDLFALVQRLDLSRLDLIIVEGFKHEAIPKIEVYRAANAKPLLYPGDADIIAIASDVPPTDPAAPAWLDLNNPEMLLNALLDYLAASLQP